MRAPTILLAVLGALACAPDDREIRLERLAAERRALDTTLDHLGDRLVTNQARVRFWQEMRERHESESVIAWAVQDEPSEEVAGEALPPAPSTPRRARAGPAPQPAAPERAQAASGAQD